MSRGAWRRIENAAFQAALFVGPRERRERYGEEMTRVFQERIAEARGFGAGAALLLLAREVVGAAAAGVRLRVLGTGPGSPGGLPSLDLPRDACYALRSLRRAPSFALTAVIVLAIGIGANTAVFSVVNAYFFSPLPFADSDQLVALYETNSEYGWVDQSAAPANMLDWREQVEAFEDVMAYSALSGRVAAIVNDVPAAISTVQVSGNFFSVLGVRPALGRSLEWEETWAGTPRTVVLSHSGWTTHFGRDPDVVGRTFRLGNQDAQIVGVMPEGFAFPAADTELWYTWQWDPAGVQDVSFRRAHYIRPIARLAPGVTLADADRHLQVVVERLQDDHPQTNRVMGAGLAPLRNFLIKDVRRPLTILSASVALLLLLACANVATLTLVQGAERKREVALRYALGAKRARVVTQLLVEALVLALSGGVLGALLGWVGIRALARLVPIGIDGATTLTLDARVVLFVLGASVLSALLFALAPALRSSHSSSREVLGDGGRGSSIGRGSLRTVHALVTAEVALAVLLVGGAALVTRSYLRVRDVNPGIRIDGVLAVQLSASTARYEARDDVLAFQDRLLDALEARPGIERAGIVEQLPLYGGSWSSSLKAFGWGPERVGHNILHRFADRAYFEAVGTRLLSGRMYDERDGPDAPRIVLVNETFAREHFPGENPLGQRIAFDRAPTESSTWFEIIGVVEDQAQVSPSVAPSAEVFEHRKQSWRRIVWIVLSTSAEPTSLVPTVREVLRELDPTIPLSRVESMRQVWRASMEREEFLLSLLGAFGSLALLLAAVGVYAVVSRVTRRRTREIGIRMAMGAEARTVRSMVLREGLVLAGFGVTLGLAGVLYAGRLLSTVLFGVSPSDPTTLVTVAAILTLTVLAACWIPAQRATRVDLVRSLTAE